MTSGSLIQSEDQNPETGWDNETNEVPEVLGGEVAPTDSILSFNSSGSFLSMGTNTTNANSYYTVGTEYISLESNMLNINTAQVSFGPTRGRSVSHPQEWITPVTFSFEDSSWKYIGATIISMMLFPFFIIASKLFKIPTGIKIRNPQYNPPR